MLNHIDSVGVVNSPPDALVSQQSVDYLAKVRAKKSQSVPVQIEPIHKAVPNSETVVNSVGDVQIITTIFRSKEETNSGTQKSQSWLDVCQSFESSIEKINKLDLPLISFAQWPNSSRESGNVPDLISAIVGDYDAGEVSFDDAINKINSTGIAAYVHTTGRHTSQKPRWRVVAPLRAPISPHQYSELVDCLNGALGGVLALESWDTTRCYFHGKVKGAEYRASKSHAECTLDDLMLCGVEWEPIGKSDRSRPRSLEIAEDRQIERMVTLNDVTTKTMHDLGFAFDAIDPVTLDQSTWNTAFLAMLSFRTTQWESQARQMIERWSALDPRWCEKNRDDIKWDREKGTRELTHLTVFKLADDVDPSWRSKANEAWEAVKVSEIFYDIEKLKKAENSPSAIVSNIIGKMANTNIGSVNEETILKRLKDATGYALKTLQAELKKAIRKSSDYSSTRVGLEYPSSTARTLVQQAYSHNGHNTIHHWQREFWHWDGVRYQTVPSDDIRPKIYSLFKQHNLEPPNRGPVDSTMDALKSIVNISSAKTMPGWLSGESPVPIRDLISMSNGLLHVPTRQLLNHDPRFFTSGSVDVSYSPDTPKPAQWFKFLDDLFPGDRESVDALQQWFGYLLTQDTSQQKRLICVGPKRCGKGTIARVLRSLLGEHNCTGPTLGQLSRPFGLQALLGRSLAIISDARVSGAADLQTISENLLRITGEDAISVDRKNIGAWEGKLTTRFVLMTNILPGIVDGGGAVASRFIVIRFTQSFFGREDPKLTDKLMSELPGILNWALDGLQMLHDRGSFLQPASGLQAVQELIRKTTPILGFITDVLEYGSDTDCWVTKTALYEVYRRWCEQEGMKFSLQKNAFLSELYTNSDGRLAPYEPRLDGRQVKAVRGARIVAGWQDP